jgi:lipoprotein-anchoring transpeptidase ErfK/SrfK
MSSLRILGLSYLATASLFTLAIFFSDHAALRLVADENVQSFAKQFQDRVVTPVVQFAHLEDEKLLDPQVSVPLSEPGPNDARTLARALPVPPMPARKGVVPDVTDQSQDLPTIIMPDLPEAPAAAAPVVTSPGDGEGYGGSVSPQLPKFVQPDARASLMPPDILQDSPLTAADRAAVTAQLTERLSPAMLRSFDLFLYVSKAKKGPLAQRLYVFKKDSSGALVMAYDWAASTGREQYEVSPLGAHTRTDTPGGFYELDPGRMYRAYHSHSWDQSMPFAMFFNWEVHGDQTGLAIHSAVDDDIAKLGSRASAGCVHISPAHAELLYNMIRSDYRGKAPRFAYDRSSQTMSNKGEFMRDAHGDLVMADGYRVLVDIEDFSGADKIVTLK